MPKHQYSYPKMPGSHKAQFENCVAFVKYNGSNLYWLWKDGQWTSFGTRRLQYTYTAKGKQEFDGVHSMALEGAHEVFDGSIRPYLSELFQTHFPGSEVIAYTEYLGPRSFAGAHLREDEKRLVLFDVSVDGGMLPPGRFLDLFGGVPDVAEVVYRGKFTGQFLEKVRNGEFLVDEGVVCKGVDKSGRVFMAKVKTVGYMETRVRNKMERLLGVIVEK